MSDFETERLAEDAVQTTAAKQSPVKKILDFFVVEDMTKGSPYKLLTRFSVPLLLGNIFQQLYNTVDSIVVGQFSGHKALAAVGNGFPFIMLLTSLFIGIGLGAMIIISQYAGAKQYEDLTRTVSTMYRCMLIGVIPLSIVGIVLARPILTLMSVPNDGTLDLSVLYMQVIFAGLIGQMGYNMNAGLLQGIGDSMTSLLFLLLATVINIVLDILLGVTMGMGVLGVALATIIAQFISWVVGIIYINKKHKYLKIDFRNLVYDHEIFKRAMRLGIPSGIQQALFSIGIFVITGLVNAQGSVFAAGFNAANKIDTFVFMPSQSFATAITTYTGQNFGARKTKRIFHGAKAGTILTASVAAAISLIIYPLSSWMMSLFTPDPDVVAAGVTYLHSVLPFFFLLATLFSINAVLRGLGKTVIAMTSTFISLWLVRVPAATLLVTYFGKDFIYYSYPIGWIAGLIISSSYFFFGKWRKDIYKGLDQYIKYGSGEDVAE